MEPPIDFTADSVRNEKVKVLRSLHTPGPKSVVRGQYGRGFVEGVEVPGYREEEGVAPDSTTETFVAAKLFVDNWRWADTPFYVRMGKRLPRRETTIAIQFKRAPHPPFEEVAAEGLRPNVLLIHVQPDEGMSLAIGAKMPGPGHDDPHRAHGLPLRQRVPRRAARGVRAADPRRDARRRDAVHARRTRSRSSGRSSTRSSPPGSATGRRSRTTPPARGGRRRPTSCSTATAAPGGGTDGRCPSLEELAGRRRLDRARSSASSRACARATVGEARQPNQRTSVMTHIAWVPPRVARGGRADARGHGGAPPVADGRSSCRSPDEPSRASTPSSRCAASRSATAPSASEVIELPLRGDRALAPASIVLPLAISDLPVFLRWRGEPPFGETQWEQLVDVADRRDRRLVRVGRAPLRASSRRSSTATAVSDIAWARTDDWRIELAGCWPEIASRRSASAARAPRRRCCAAGSRRGSTARSAPSSRRASSACASTARSCARRTSRAALAERPAERRARPLRAATASTRRRCSRPCDAFGGDERRGPERTWPVGPCPGARHRSRKL